MNSEWGFASLDQTPTESEMEVIDVDCEPVHLCQNEIPEEVFSIDWRPASDMFWHVENRKSALLEYLIQYGPRDFPPYKKRLKHLRRVVARLGDGEKLHDTSDCTAQAKLSSIQALFAEIVSHVTVATVRLNQPGLHKFFVEGIGKDVLPSLERKHSCSVEAISEIPLVVLSDDFRSSPLRDLEEVVNKLNPNSEVSVFVSVHRICLGLA